MLQQTATKWARNRMRMTTQSPFDLGQSGAGEIAGIIAFKVMGQYAVQKSVIDILLDMNEA